MSKVRESSRRGFRNKNRGARYVEIFFLQLRLSVLFSEVGFYSFYGEGQSWLQNPGTLTTDVGFGGRNPAVGIGQLTAFAEVSVIGIRTHGLDRQA